MSASTRGLLGSEETISRIAFSLGFEYPQHFSTPFKRKTGASPSEFRDARARPRGSS